MASSLAHRTIRGIAWTLPTSLGSRAVGLVGTLILVRYLAPAEYGEVAAAGIATMAAGSLTTFGVGIFLVSTPDVSRAEVFHATCWFLATGVAALAVLWGLSGPIGAWSGAPGLERFVPLFVLSTLLDRVVYLPERMLVRQLRFRRISLAGAFADLAYTGVSLAGAALGAGAVAIAWGNLARSSLRFAALVPAVEWREWLEPHRLRLATMARIVGYGVNVSMASIPTFAMRRLDNLLVSRYFGPGVMGAYNYAYNLADTPAVAIGEQIGDVVGASFPHMGREERAAALVRACAGISLVMFPLAFGLAAVAPTVVQTFFDQRWPGIGTMLLVLSVLSAARPVALLLTSYLYACQRPRVVLWLEWLSFVALIGAISTVGRIGTTWTCGSVGAVFVLRTLLGMWMVRRLDGIPMSSFLLPLARPLVVCVAMAAAIVLLRPPLLGLPPAARLLIEVALGGAVYLGGVLVIFPSSSREIIDGVRSALVRSAVPSPAGPGGLPAGAGPAPLDQGGECRIRSRS
ncbi:MAG TPA: oligosaccharide flippase family protein [Anaeromyxobacteraceae bacterium]|nr:oligosaccharide flippase family protein [Anaeromyxobacteraceae bacterium]